MPLYDYLCDTCGARWEEVFGIREDSGFAFCPNCQSDSSTPGTLDDGSTPVTLAAAPRGRKIITRFPGIAHGMVRESHYNMTVGKVVSSDTEFKSELSRQSDEASERNGFAVSFQPIDHRESRDALGVTDEGLDSTYSEQVKSGKRDTVKHF